MDKVKINSFDVSFICIKKNKECSKIKKKPDKNKAKPNEEIVDSNSVSLACFCSNNKEKNPIKMGLTMFHKGMVLSSLFLFFAKLESLAICKILNLNRYISYWITISTIR